MSQLLHHALHDADSRAPTLLLIHPLGADLTFWDECVACWKSRVSCVACDLRSAGQSPRASGPVSIAHHVADLVALCDALELDAVIPVGCAVGAMTAVAFAANHPQRTRGLILCNPALRTSPEAKAMLSARAAAVRRAGMLDILPGAVDKAFDAQPRDDRYARYLARFALQDAEGYALSVLGILDADASADLAAIRVPALVIAGGHDVLLPPAMSHMVHQLMPQAQFAQFDEAAHFVPYQAPQRFATLVADFVDGIDRAALHGVTHKQEWST
jgi:3-oxoadipate enol-lactonase